MQKYTFNLIYANKKRTELVFFQFGPLSLTELFVVRWMCVWTWLMLYVTNSVN